METDLFAVVSATVTEAVASQQGLLDPAIVEDVVRASILIKDALERGNKLILFGNGGSASDSSHIAAEFVGRFERERRALPAVSLCDNHSALTAIGNDYGFEQVFSRQLEAVGQSGDVVLAITTSGRSPNVLRAVREAPRLSITTIGMTGASGGELCGQVDLCLRVPAQRTARVQEGHILLAHILCDLVERQLS
jgi:D-sedoheptulose 7-phosphate isomerase